MKLFYSGMKLCPKKNISIYGEKNTLLDEFLLSAQTDGFIFL